VCLVLEEFVRLLHHCGMSLSELDICNGRGTTVNEIMAQGVYCFRFRFVLVFCEHGCRWCGGGGGGGSEGCCCHRVCLAWLAHPASALCCWLWLVATAEGVGQAAGAGATG
jgi:hypothetical protein